MKNFLAPFIFVATLFCASEWATADMLSLQASGGAAYNFRLPLVIRQDGQDTIRHNADYDTKPFETPIYYSVRLGRWREDAAWELELVHQKLTLTNNPPEVEYFSVTHGFNLLTVNRAWKTPWFIWRIGAGVVITHPESTIRGKTFDQQGGIADGYYLSGPTVQIALEKRVYLYRGLYASLEGKYTLSWAHIPVSDGNADLWNSALHGLFGLGIDF